VLDLVLGQVVILCKRLVLIEKGVLRWGVLVGVGVFVGHEVVFGLQQFHVHPVDLVEEQVLGVALDGVDAFIKDLEAG